VVIATDPYGRKFSFSTTEPLLFHSRSSSHPHEVEWIPFQTHYFSEYVVTPAIEPGTSQNVASNSEVILRNG
jgi:hypothetical protein